MNNIMKSLKISALLMLSLMSHFSFAETASYRLLEGDRVAVSVWGEETLNMKDVVVLPDGSISFPLIGSLKVSGMTSTEVSSAIAEKLKAFLPEPQVTVVVTGLGGSLAYVIGKVSKPGPVSLHTPITVMQALSLAGALDKFAEGRQIKVIRMKSDGTQEIHPINYEALIEGKQLDTNILLRPGDTVLVP